MSSVRSNAGDERHQPEILTNNDSEWWDPKIRLERGIGVTRSDPVSGASLHDGRGIACT